jgi:hypothetical protein
MADELGGSGESGWREYQKLVLSELRRLDNNVEKLGERIDRSVKHERGNRQQVENTMQTEINRISLEVHGLKIKAGVWGLAGGLIPVITALVLKQL